MANAGEIIQAAAAILRLVNGGTAGAKTEVEKRGELLALGHICGSIRDEGQYDDLIPELAKAIGCTPERVRQVLAAIGQVAYKAARKIG